MSELRPCPACGSESYLHTEDVFFVDCWKCRFSGPDSGTEEDAVESWNALPRSLRWEKEPPTEPGLYWYKENENERGRIASIYNMCGHWLFDYLGDDCSYDFPTKGKWSGPIQEPVN